MIEVTVRYDTSYVTISEVISDIRDRVESAVALICEKEQEHVDVTLFPWSYRDEHGRNSDARDILIKIDVDACPGKGHGDVLSASDFTVSLANEFHEIFGADAPRPRVWVRPIVGGSFAE